MVERGGIFNPGATFSNYVGYVRKASFFLEEPIFRDTSALKNVVSALKLKGDGVPIPQLYPNRFRSQNSGFRITRQYLCTSILYFVPVRLARPIRSSNSPQSFQE